jgi:hypothetical protein
MVANNPLLALGILFDDVPSNSSFIGGHGGGCWGTSGDYSSRKQRAGVSAQEEVTPRRRGDGAWRGTRQRAAGRRLPEDGEMATDAVAGNACATARARIGLPDDPECTLLYTRV